MSKNDSFYELPKDLPIPVDDGACNHLGALQVPSVSLISTAGHAVDLASLPGRTALYCYPRTGRPGQPLPSGWNEIPGARGCTPQSCGFRDHFTELQALGVRLYGLSTQDPNYQKEVVQRLHLPFELLSDSDMVFARSLRLPTFEVESMILIKRLTLIIDDRQISKVFYPIFPPNKNVDEVLEWLSRNPR